MLLLVPLLVLGIAFALWRSGHRWASLGCVGTLVAAAALIALLYLVLTALGR